VLLPLLLLLLPTYLLSTTITTTINTTMTSTNASYLTYKILYKSHWNSHKTNYHKIPVLTDSILALLGQSSQHALWTYTVMSQFHGISTLITVRKFSQTLWAVCNHKLQIDSSEIILSAKMPERMHIANNISITEHNFIGIGFCLTEPISVCLY